MVKLADVATMEYFTSHGQGEVCVKGANVFQVLTSAELHNIFSVCSCQGYFRDEARTQATLDPEGWLHTGDIGEWTRWAQLSSTSHHGYTLH